MTKSKQILTLKSKDFKVGEIVIIIPYENNKGEVKYYTLRKSKFDKLVPEIQR